VKRFSILDFGFSIGSGRKRIFCLAVCAVLFALCSSIEAQQPKRVPRIGFIWHLAPSVAAFYNDAFRQGLHELGYVEGKSIIVEYRYVEARGELLVEVASDLARQVDLIVASPAPPVIRAAKQATRTVPVVMGGVVIDPVAAGFVATLGRPGGNITGLTNLQTELRPKRLELLKETFPRISRVAILWPPAQEEQGIKEAAAVGQALGVQILSVIPRSPGALTDLESAFSAISRGRSDALSVATFTLALDYRARIIDFAAKNRIPTMYDDSRFVTAGGLMSYGTDWSELYRRLAGYVDKILKGAKPADLPVEQPTKFELVINLKSAKQIGLTIPPNVLARADKVIK
jgi:putative ABC transport system substrate-binding protein